MENKRIVFPKLRFRFLSVMLDFIAFSAISLVLLYLVFNKVFDTTNEEDIVLLTQVNAGVLVKDESGIYVQLNSTDYIKYQEVVEKYYISDTYFGSNFYKEHNGTRSKYTIEEYNENILYCGESESYFEYATINGNIDKNVLGVIKSKYYVDNDRGNDIREEYISDFYSFYTKQYKAIFTDLYNDSFYNESRNIIKKEGAYAFFASFIISYALIYIIPPLTNKYGYTLGRFIFKLSLVTRDGLYQKRYMFLIRNVIPVLLISIILSNDNLFFIGPIIIVYLLLNWLICVMSKENASLLDLISFSRVVSKKESEIYYSLDEIKDENK